MRAGQVTPEAPDTTGASKLGGLGILGSISDLPKTQALGIELRASSALAVTMSAIDGTWTAEPFRVRHEPLLGDDPLKNVEIIADTLKQTIAHFKWTGVLGISITKLVAKGIGVPDDSFSQMEAKALEILSSALSKSKVKKTAFLHVMLHTTAAGYSELVFGDSGADNDRWKGKTILCCTLGKSMGAVLFNDGRRVRHREWCKTVVAGPNGKEDSCPPPIGNDEAGPPFAPDDQPFAPPEPGTAEWDSWTASVDQSLVSMMDSVQGLDRVLVMPTGRTARNLYCDEIREKLTASHDLAAGKSCQLSLLGQPEGSVVRGAAICALVELESTQVLKSLKQVLNKADSLQSLSKPQLRFIFEQLDTAGDNKLWPLELQAGLEQLGVQRDTESLLRELNVEEGGTVSMEQFISWWTSCVRSARIVTLTSSSAWRRLLLEVAPPEGFGDFICLEVTYTFCRACRRFEAKFRKFAEQYQDVRFVQLVGNGTIGAMDLSTKELVVKKSPAFFIFRRGSPEPLLRWTGSSEATFKEHLDKVQDL